MKRAALPASGGRYRVRRATPSVQGLLLLLLPVLGFFGAALRAQDENDAAAKADEGIGAGLALMSEKGKCSVCHKPDDWRDLKDAAGKVFNHASTGFPLLGKHTSAKCSDCHKRKGLAGLSQSCTTCHRDPHGSQNTKTCSTCHTDRSWRVPRNFFIHEATRFPLMGKHASVGCEACHRNARSEPLRAAPTECIVCHARDFQNAVPDHTAGFSADCTQCHTQVIPPRTFKGP